MAAQKQQQQQQQQLTPAQIAQYYPPNPGIATWSPHFWEPSTTACRNIGRIYTKGPAYTNEGVVWNAWNAILIIYFPQNATTANGISWSIEWEAYRGLPPTQNSSQTKRNVIAVRLNPTQVPQGQVPQIEGRDFLWVECKAASHDKASGWKDVLNESVTQLAHAHSTRPLYLIIAVGWKCMFFLWDPIGMVQQQSQCRIRSEDNTK